MTMMKSFISNIIITLLLFLSRKAKSTEAGSNIKREESDNENILNVHIVPHTHDDVGWQKTYDQYYYGLNSTIRRAGVKNILKTTLLALAQNPRRTFTYVEMAFFARYYYNDCTKEEQDKIKDLIKNKQLSFANGGYVMHDEATTHYISMIDQTQLGHAFLKNELDYIPTIGWQLDPFGHSYTNALLSRLFGFNAMYFGRIDEQDLQKRYQEQNCEALWLTTTTSSSTNSSIFWGLTGSYKGNYGPPPGFCLDDKCDDEVITPDNKVRRATEFLYYLIEQGNHTKGNNIMLTMGSDFTYENAFYNYDNLDLLIDTLNEEPFQKELLSPYDTINVFYSSPENYTQAKYLENLQLQIKTDDFFPYSDCKHCYWTGYFTSRPNFKKMERFASSLLHMARQLTTFYSSSSSSSSSSPSLQKIETSLAIAQHHDAVSGTSKQHVLYDYAKLLHEGMTQATSVASNALSMLLSQNNSNSTLYYCMDLNISSCSFTQQASLDQKDFTVVIYNALTRTRQDILPIPVMSDVTYQVLHNSTIIDSVLFKKHNYAKANNVSSYLLYFDTGSIPPLSAAVYHVKILAQTSSSIKRSKVDKILKHSQRFQRYLNTNKVQLYVQHGSIYISNSKTRIRLEKHVGFVDEITDLETNVSVEFKQRWGYYRSFDADYHHQEEEEEKQSSETFSDSTYESSSEQYSKSISNPKTLAKVKRTLLLEQKNKLNHFKEGRDDSKKKQNSGAYIFRPHHKKGNFKTAHTGSCIIYKSDLLIEVHYKFRGGANKEYTKQIIRLKKDAEAVEVEYSVGPIPDYDNHGREIVVKYETNVASNQVFYTDSNGREFMKRTRGYRPTWDYKEYEPIAGNYYPINAGIYIKDCSAALGILTDRSVGGSSLDDGSIELMVHRRTKADDARGVDEPLDETRRGIHPCPPYGDAKRIGLGIVSTGIHYLHVTSSEKIARSCRLNMDLVYSPLHMFVTLDNNDDYLNSTFQGIAEALPPHVFLVSFQRIQENKFLVRLAHQFSIMEDYTYSLPVQVDFQSLFTYKSFMMLKVSSVVEKTLSGNQDLSVWEQSSYQWTTNTIKQTFKAHTAENGTVVTLNPMDIRAFEVVLTSRFPKEFVDDKVHLSFM